MSIMVGPAAAALGGVIRRQREHNAISMRQFATMAGISNPYLSQIERGHRAPSERVLGAIAQALGIPVDVLYQQAGLSHDDARDQPARDALASDPHLTGRQRRALLDVYDAFVAQNTG